MPLFLPQQAAIKGTKGGFLCSTGPPQLRELQPELLVLIASFLDAPEHVLSLRSAFPQARWALDASGWMGLITRRWGTIALPQGSTSLKAQMQAYTAEFHYFLPAEQISGAWTDDDSHFSRRALPGTRSATALQLLHVWWLDLVGTFQVGRGSMVSLCGGPPDGLQTC